MPRIFVAITLPERTGDAIAEATAAMAESRREVAWVRASALHLTAKFIGECPEDQMAGIASAIRSVARQVEPVTDLSLGEVGAFPNFRRPRIVWLGVSPPHALDRLTGQLERTLVLEGVRAESRPFRAHLTLGRVRRPLSSEAARELEAAARQVLGRWPLSVSALELMRSDHAPGGSVYTRLERFPLGGS